MHTTKVNRLYLKLYLIDLLLTLRPLGWSRNQSLEIWPVHKNSMVSKIHLKQYILILEKQNVSGPRSIKISTNWKVQVNTKLSAGGGGLEYVVIRRCAIILDTFFGCSRIFGHLFGLFQDFWVPFLVIPGFLGIIFW